MPSRFHLAAFFVLGAMSVASAGADPAEDVVFFRERIEPLLRERCYECHSHESGKMKNGLTLDSRAGWSEGGDAGPALVPGKPDGSLLIKAVRRVDADTAMPPKKPLAADEVALLTEWVKRGAPDPRTSAVAKRPDNDWWSLKPLVVPPSGGTNGGS